MFKKSLEAKIIGIIASVLIVGFGTMSYLNIRKISGNLREEEHSKLDLISTTMVSMIKRTMLDGNAPQMSHLVEDLKEIKDLTVLQILRKDGKEAFSDNETLEKVNSYLGASKKKMGVFPLNKTFPKKTETYSYFKKMEEVLQNSSKIRFVEQIEGIESLTQLTPILKDEACEACHGYDSHAVRGVLRISIHLHDVEDEIASSRNTLLKSSAVIILVVLTLLRLSIKKMVIEPIQMLVEALKQLAEGNLNYTVNVHTEDEIGLLEQWLKKMSENMRTIQLQSRKSVQHMMLATKRITVTAEEQEQVSTEHAAAIIEISATAEELNQTSKQILDKAELMARESDNTVKFANEGQQAVQVNIERMEAIRKKVEAISMNIFDLSGQTQQISRIIKSLDEIAAKTDMLAINAAIEASRAGEQGKGFAVVSGEVKKLSEQSQQATERISTLLNDIQASTNSVVMSVDEGCKDCETGMNMMMESSDVVARMMEVIKRTSDFSKRVSLASKKQSIATSQLSDALMTLSKGTEGNAESSKHLLETAESLGESSRDMKNVMEKYTL